jgi:hypothetical protein
LAVLLLSLCVPSIGAANLRLNEKNYFETHGLNVLLFHNSYHDVFGDQKMGGLEIILHEQRIAANGDVRLSPTPAQWDPIPHFKERKRGPAENELTRFLGGIRSTVRSVARHRDVLKHSAPTFCLRSFSPIRKRSTRARPESSLHHLGRSFCAQEIILDSGAITRISRAAPDSIQPSGDRVKDNQIRFQLCCFVKRI